MHAITIPQMKQVIQHIVLEENEPAMFVGQFGNGKTVGCDQAVKLLGGVLCDIRLGQYDTVDLKGYPDTVNGFMVWRPASTLPFVGNDNFPDDKIIYLVFDEITSATPSVFAIAYQLINERRVGEHVLKPNVRIIAMGNRESDKGVVNRMPMPLSNRMTWFEVVVDVPAWCLHAQAMGWPPVFIAFHQFRKGVPMLCTYDPKKAEKVVATPRTWEKAIKYFLSTMPHDIKLAAMAGAIGQGPSDEFWGFVNIWHKLIPIEKIIKDPMGTAIPEPKEAGMRYALAISISGSMTVDNAKPLYAYLQRMDPEFTILAWQMGLARDPDLYTTDEFLDFAKKFKVVFA